MPSVGEPVFRVYLMRHGRSGWARPGQKDFDRTLDNTGVREAGYVAALAAGRNLRPDAIFSSTAMRCRQTAQLVGPVLAPDLGIIFVDALYAGPTNVYHDLIGRQAGASVLVVGHNPMMEELLHDLAGESAESAIAGGFPTAGLAVIDFQTRADGKRRSHGGLVAMLTPHG
ncbi:SixA phosphatase family protein [Pararhizobium sp.]|uniref:SixA phosphatase family protein n=1 Tax=Pararhizobium sp. TaxID=1977563 RepID=UPI0027258EBD|nr:histidine phosphatase family protein [Pararhizobium sp.]MDO9418908.1 histidine phosphatase family protein [Pararhizobium sp.]